MSIQTQLRPEPRLLLHCVTPSFADNGAGEVQTLARQADPSIAIALASWHGVVPLVASRFRNAITGLIPAELQDPMEETASAIARRNLLLTAALVRVMTLFETESIPAAAFKGPVLALELYGDLALRPFLDLDIMVAREHVEQSERLLGAAGYHPGPAGGRSSRWRQRQGQKAFHRSDGSQIDLHWRALPAYFTSGSILERCQATNTIPLGGVSIRTLSPDALLLHLSAHGTKHTWDRLKWISDVAWFVRRHGGLDWDRTLHAARSSGVERMILVALWLAHELLETDPPHATVRRIEADAAVGALGRQVCARLFEDHRTPETFWPPWRFNIRARERMRDKARCGLRLISALGLSDCPAAARRVLSLRST